MMVPDYAMIAEIKLYSFGFSDARNLARKLTLVLVLCSEQLSSQKHYDYGMRAVFSILVRAGNLRQSMGHKWTEDLIVLSSIVDVNLPKFTTNDLPLFRGITQDLFPGVSLPRPDYRKLLRAIRDACRSANLQAKESFVRSTTQLFETVQVGHKRGEGLALFGGGAFRVDVWGACGVSVSAFAARLLVWDGPLLLVFFFNCVFTSARVRRRCVRVCP